jgi:hypothetical protein
MKYIHTLFFVVFISLPFSAFACSCGESRAISEYAESYDIIFLGTAIESSLVEPFDRQPFEDELGFKHHGVYQTTFKVKSAFKGRLSEEVKVNHSISDSCYSTSYYEKVEYYVFADILENGEIVPNSICGPSWQEFWDGQIEDYFKNGKDSRPLSRRCEMLLENKEDNEIFISENDDIIDGGCLAEEEAFNKIIKSSN